MSWTGPFFFPLYKYPDSFLLLFSVSMFLTICVNMAAWVDFRNEKKVNVMLLIQGIVLHLFRQVWGMLRQENWKGKNTMSTLRKCSYNIVRLLQMKDQKGREYVPDIIDDICDDLEIDLRMIFSPIPSFYWYWTLTAKPQKRINRDFMPFFR